MGVVSFALLSCARVSDNRIMIPARFRVWCRHGLADGHVLLMQQGRRGLALVLVCRSVWSHRRAMSSGLCVSRGEWWVPKDRRGVEK